MRGKRILSGLLGLCLLALCACGKTEAPPEPTAAPEPTATPVPTPEPERVLVVYFSRTGEMPEVGVIEKGSTEILAETIAQKLNADLFEIRPADDRYPTVYQELYDIALEEKTAKARPAIAGTLPALDDYDAVFLGAPVWHGDWPMILYTYFEGAALAGKKLVPFCTNQGSGLSGLDEKLALACPRSQVEKGLAVLGTDAQNNPEKVDRAVDRWLTGLGYATTE